jgi:putative membrane protein
MAITAAENAIKLDTSTRLAYDRTRLAYERTMMAWVRTATSLISFGFTIYKFFQIERAGHEEEAHFIGSRGFALLMISIGLLSLLMATFEHRQSMRGLKAQCPDLPRSLATFVAALIAILGLVALVVVIFRQ